MRTEPEIKSVIEKYADTVRRLCFVYLKNREDTEDVFQTVFLKYACYIKSFKSSEHEKAWIIRVTINQCKDCLKNSFRKNTVSIESIANPDGLSQFRLTPESSSVIEAVQELPEKYRVPVYLFYIEGYSAVEIGKMLDKNVNTVYTSLKRGRDTLREKLLKGGGEYEK